MSVLLKDILAVEETVKVLIPRFCLIGVSRSGVQNFEINGWTCGHEERMVQKLVRDDIIHRMAVEVLMVGMRGSERRVIDQRIDLPWKIDKDKAECFVVKVVGWNKYTNVGLCNCIT